MRRTLRALLCALPLAVLVVACNPASRYRTLSLFFDGVPPPPTPEQIAAREEAEKRKKEGGFVPLRATRIFLEHGPYAARMCTSCHESASSNTYVRPKEELCTFCHSFGPAKQVVHDPFDSNDCMDCHDPHSGRYPGILVAEVNTVCHGCHEAEVIADRPEHTDTAVACTKCHDPHQSDKAGLLR